MRKEKILPNEIIYQNKKAYTVKRLYKAIQILRSYTTDGISIYEENEHGTIDMVELTFDIYDYSGEYQTVSKNQPLDYVAANYTEF